MDGVLVGEKVDDLKGVHLLTIFTPLHQAKCKRKCDASALRV
jgi:hypothetical protein